MKIDVLSATVLGLFTVGIYWTYVFKKWLTNNRDHKLANYENSLSGETKKQFSDNIDRRTRNNIKFALIVRKMLVIGVVVFVIEAIAELGFSKFLIQEELLWFYIWLVFSLFAVLLASIGLQLRNTLIEEETLAAADADFVELSEKTHSEKPWLLKGEGKRIYILAVIHIALALGLVPFIIFPPILGSAMNSYVKIEEEKL